MEILKQSFKTLKDILEDEINDFLEKLISITQPAAIILVGLLVGNSYNSYAYANVHFTRKCSINEEFL